MQKETLTRREQILAALLFAPVAFATLGLLMLRMEVAIGLAAPIWTYRNADRLNQHDDRERRRRRPARI